MKKIALILAAIFVVGALTGTITAFAKEKGNATPKDPSGIVNAGSSKPSGGSGTATVIPTSDPTFKSVIANESLQQSIDFDVTGLTENSDNGKWALWTDEGFTVTQKKNINIKNTKFSYLGNDGVDTKCDFTFRMSRDYNRKDSHFSASFDLLGSLSGTLISQINVSLEDAPGSYNTANILVIHNEQLYAVDKDRGEVKIANIPYGTPLTVSYHVDMLTHKVQIWVGAKYAGEYTLATNAVDDHTANQYFSFYCPPEEQNVGREITFDNIKIYY